MISKKATRIIVPQWKRRKIAILSIIALFSFCPDYLFAQKTSVIDSLELVLKTAKEDTGKVNLLNRLSFEIKNTGNLNKVIQYENDAVSLALKINYNKGALIAYRNLGLAYTNLDNYPEALRNLLASQKIAEETGNKQGIAASYNGMGNVFNRQGNYTEAMKDYIEALRIFEEIGEKKSIANAYNNIGILFTRQRNYPEALKNYMAAVMIRKEIGDKAGIADTYNNIGNVCSNQGNYPEAIQHYMASLKIREEIGNKKLIADSYNNIGHIYSRQGNYSEALYYYMPSLKAREEIGDKSGIVTSCNNIGVAYVSLAKNENELEARQKRTEASQYLNRALSLAKDIGFKEGIQNSYIVLAETDSAMGNYEMALKHYKLYSLYRDSLVNEESNKQVSQMKIQYETEKKDKEIDLLNKEKSISLLQVEKQKASLLTSTLELENNRNEILLLNKTKELQQFQLVKSREDLDHQRLEAKAQAVGMALMTKDKELKEQQLQKQKLLRNGMFAGVAFLVLVVLLFFRSWQLRKKLEKQRAIMQERKRISADLHDDIGSGLSKISLLSEMVKEQAKTTEAKKEAEKIATTSKQLLESIGEIIWALNSNNDYLENLVSYIRRYAAEYFQNSSVKVNIGTPEIVLQTPVSGEYRRNIFYAVKEALHNIIKHADATEAEIKVTLDNGLFSISIQDNGKGFPEGERNRFGNGISNMINRMETIHGNVLVENHIGTKITLTMPV